MSSPGILLGPDIREQRKSSLFKSLPNGFKKTGTQVNNSTFMFTADVELGSPTWKNQKVM